MGLKKVGRTPDHDDGMEIREIRMEEKRIDKIRGNKVE